MIKVYFKNSNGTYSDLIATFKDEKVYLVCLPSLKKLAREQGFGRIVLESIETN